MPLTDTQIKAIKPEAKPRKYADEKGLFLLAAITDPQEVGALMRAIDGFSGTFIVKAALRLAPLVFVRPGELRQARWAEIDFDKAEWRIPAERMKTRNEHIVPLARQALAILEELRPLTGHREHVFIGARDYSRPMSGAAINGAASRKQVILDRYL